MGSPITDAARPPAKIYDMELLTAAHRRLPFQTWVEVTNLSNGKQVDVRINDRGPFVKGRIVDLSQAAARQIDMLRAGTARVRLKVIPAPRRAARTGNGATAPPVTASQTRHPAEAATWSKPALSPNTTEPNLCARHSRTASRRSGCFRTGMCPHSGG